MNTTQSQYKMIDPGAEYGLDIEQASMLIGKARQWEPGSPQREIERNSFGWKILRAYQGLRVAQLEQMTGVERFELLTTTGRELRLVFGTARPAWAFHTDYADKHRGGTGPCCIHSRDLIATHDAYVSIQRLDTLDETTGEINIGRPSVFVQADSENMSPSTLLHLARACRAATEQLAWIR
ncbi:hypothetical protein [Pseudarthrobacter sp. NPDC080039]|uniref:hypothetical protein n=1 Tax=unclassified Pseudarthrobacter TaxID=2647000 RepID=UPI00344CA3BB